MCGSCDFHAVRLFDIQVDVGLASFSKSSLLITTRTLVRVWLLVNTFLHDCKTCVRKRVLSTMFLCGPCFVFFE